VELERFESELTNMARILEKDEKGEEFISWRNGYSRIELVRLAPRYGFMANGHMKNGQLGERHPQFNR